jgi:hypothetical protein
MLSHYAILSWDKSHHGSWHTWSLTQKLETIDVIGKVVGLGW